MTCGGSPGKPGTLPKLTKPEGMTNEAWALEHRGTTFYVCAGCEDCWTKEERALHRMDAHVGWSDYRQNEDAALLRSALRRLAEYEAKEKP